MLAEQAAGLLAGWSSAIKHHLPPSKAPLRSRLVDGLALGARAIGKLSPDLRAELAYKTLRDYCWYNVDAEETAELCWRRLIELDAELGYGNEAAFTRIATEEAQHREVFAVIGELLDESDGIRESAKLVNVRDRFAAIDQRLVAPRFRAATRDAKETVHVVDGEHGTKRAAADELFGRLGLDKIAGRSVAIKASWMLGYSRRDPSSITDPSLLEDLVAVLDRAGASEVTLLDGANLYSNLYRNRSVEGVAAYFSLPDDRCDIADTAADVVPLRTVGPFGPTAISRLWRDADIRISVTRLRSHPTEHVHLTTANTEGLIEDSCRNIFWNRSYDYSAAALAVGHESPANVAIVDAWEDCPDGWFGIMAGPKPKHPNRLYGGTDPLAVDLVVLRHTGSAAAVESPTLRRAIEQFGDPRCATEVVGVDTKIDGWRNPFRTRFGALVADISYPIYRWLSRGGAVFTPPMDEVFIEVTPLPAPLRSIRSVARAVLGVRPPARSA